MEPPWRIQYSGAIYHIMSHGVSKEEIFLKSAINKAALRLRDQIETTKNLKKKIGKIVNSVFKIWP